MTPAKWCGLSFALGALEWWGSGLQNKWVGLSVVFAAFYALSSITSHLNDEARK